MASTGACNPLKAVTKLTRPFLHAERLVITHPRTKERMEFTAPIPADLEAIATNRRSLDPRTVFVPRVDRRRNPPRQGRRRRVNGGQPGGTLTQPSSRRPSPVAVPCASAYAQGPARNAHGPRQHRDPSRVLLISPDGQT
jgi:hypothetical protein